MKMPTFIINLPNRPDRLAKIKAQLDKFGIFYYVWAATKNEDGKKGLVETMRELFAHCAGMDYDNVFVFEDDSRILSDEFLEIIYKCVLQLPKDYELFYAGCNLHGKCKRYSENLIEGTGFYSSHAVMYSKAAIFRILSLLKNYNCAYDELLVKEIQREGNTFCSFPLLVSQENGYSDIAKRNVNYEKFIEKRYEEKTNGLL